MSTLDNAKNFAKATVSIGYDAAAVTIVLQTGGGAKMPTAPFNIVWWNVTDYPDPSDDPNVEVVRCTNVSSDTLTIVRAQEGTIASTKNTSGKVYKMIAPLTAKVINTDIPGIAGLSIKSITSGNIDATNTVFGFAAQPTIIFVNGTGYRVGNGWTWNSGASQATISGPVGIGGDIYAI